MTRAVSAEYIAMIQQNQQSQIADLYTITLKDGVSDYFTDIDTDIAYNGNDFKSGSLRITGLRMKLAVGLEVDEQEIKIAAQPEDLLAGVPFLREASLGLLDGATITRDRAVWAPNAISPHFVFHYEPPITVFRMFYGLVSEVTKIGRTYAELKVKSPLKLLDLNLPKKTYQAPCSWPLYSAGCTLDKATFAVPGETGGGWDGTTSIPWAGGVPMSIGGDGAPYFCLGWLVFTSGNLANRQFHIANNDSAYLYIIGDTAAPQGQPGDTFTAYPGCFKTREACNLKFGNILNYRGFPFVPPVVLSA